MDGERPRGDLLRMTRKINNPAAFCKRFSVTTGCCEAGARFVRAPGAHFQPLASISRTAARFLAPICSAETRSGVKAPKLLRIALSP